LIRNDIEISEELFFALAHELRHAYQIASCESLEEYRTSDRISIEQYNLQPLEVDANAFGALIMSDFFGIVPQFRNMPDTVRKAIKDRMKQLQKEYT
jgi:hypothetical protein